MTSSQGLSLLRASGRSSQTKMAVGASLRYSRAAVGRSLFDRSRVEARPPSSFQHTQIIHRSVGEPAEGSLQFCLRARRLLGLDASALTSCEFEQTNKNLAKIRSSTRASCPSLAASREMSIDVEQSAADQILIGTLFCLSMKSKYNS